LIEKNSLVEEMPEMFCFGLLESFDMLQLAAMSAPRPLRWANASDRARAELAPLRQWYAPLGGEFKLDE
jgi:hypothetical protein